MWRRVNPIGWTQGSGIHRNIQIVDLGVLKFSSPRQRLLNFNQPFARIRIVPRFNGRTIDIGAERGILSVRLTRMRNSCGFTDALYRDTSASTRSRDTDVLLPLPTAVLLSSSPHRSMKIPSKIPHFATETAISTI